MPENTAADPMMEPVPPGPAMPAAPESGRYQALLLATFFILLFLILTVHVLVEYRS